MKKLIMVCMALSLLFLGAACKSDEYIPLGMGVSAPLFGAASVLPADTQMLFMVSPLSQAYDAFAIKADSVMGRPVDGIADLEKQLGFNLLDRKMMDEFGVDMSREAGLAIVDMLVDGDTPTARIVLFLPVKATAVFEKIESLIEDQAGSGVTLSRESGRLIITKTDDGSIAVVFIQDGYLFVVLDTDGDVRPFAESLARKEKPLSDNPEFKEVWASLGEKIDGGIFYFDMADFFEKNASIFTMDTQQNDMLGLPDVSPDKMLDLLKDYGVMISHIDLMSPSLVMRGGMFLKDTGIFQKMLSDTDASKAPLLSVRKNPMGFMSMPIVMGEYASFITGLYGMQDQYDALIKSGSETLGLDVQKDLIDLMDRGMSVAIYDGASVSPANMNMAFSVGSSRASELHHIVDGIVAGQLGVQPDRKKIGNADASLLNLGPMKVVYGAVGEALVICMGEETFKEAASGKSGFASSMSDAMLKEAMLDERVSVMYLSVDELMKGLKNFKAFIPLDLGGDVEKVVEKFEFLEAAGLRHENLVLFRARIKTRFSKPFFQALLELLQPYL